MASGNAVGESVSPGAAWMLFPFAYEPITAGRCGMAPPINDVEITPRTTPSIGSDPERAPCPRERLPSTNKVFQLGNREWQAPTPR